MRVSVAVALVVCAACKLEAGTVECGDGITCPAGTSCLDEPVGGVYCVSELCGNGRVDPGEACDGEVATGCVDLGLPFDGGRPTCTATCTLDLTSCELFGFRPVFEGTAPVRQFCAYEEPPGTVVARFFQDDRLFEVRGESATELGGSLAQVRDLACLPGKVAAITRDAIASFDAGTWTLNDVRFSDGTLPHWQAITESDDAFTAVGWASLLSSGYGGIMVAGDGTVWTVEHENGYIMTEVGAHGTTRIAADDHGTLFTRTPTGAWSVLTNLAPFASTVGDLCVVAVDDVLASSLGQLMRWSPNTWQSQPASPGAIAATPSGTVFVAGIDGILGHRDRYRWEHATGLGVLDDLWVAQGGTLYASRASELLRADALWLEVPVRTTSMSSTMVGTQPTLVLHRPGVMVLNNTGKTIDGSYVAAGAAGGVAFVVGRTPFFGTAARLDLANPLTWPNPTMLPETKLEAVFAAGPNLAYAAGANGHVIRYNGAWEAPVTAIAGVTLRALTRTANEFIVAGDGGAVATSPDGVTWTRVDVGTTRHLRAIYAGETDVFIVGDGGTIVRRSGTEWAVMESPTTRDLFAIHGSGDRLVAVGDRAIVQLDASRWISLRPPVPGTIFKTVLVEPPYVYAGADSQSFVLYRP